MKKIFLNISILLFATILSTTSKASPEEQGHITLHFLSGRMEVSITRQNTENGDRIDAYLIGPSMKGRVLVDRYDPEGGVTPEIKSIFTYGKASKKLLVIVSWGSDSPAIGTGGSIYEVFAYDESVDDKFNQPRLHPDEKLTEKLGTGFEGVREGVHVRYKYKTALDVKRQLLEWGYR